MLEATITPVMEQPQVTTTGSGSGELNMRDWRWCVEPSWTEFLAGVAPAFALSVCVAILQGSSLSLHKHSNRDCGILCSWLCVSHNDDKCTNITISVIVQTMNNSLQVLPSLQQAVWAYSLQSFSQGQAWLEQGLLKFILFLGKPKVLVATGVGECQAMVAVGVFSPGHFPTE